MLIQHSIFKYCPANNGLDAKKDVDTCPLWALIVQFVWLWNYSCDFAWETTDSARRNLGSLIANWLFAVPLSLFFSLVFRLVGLGVWVAPKARADFMAALAPIALCRHEFAASFQRQAKGCAV